jgi:hypothetical protein
LNSESHGAQARFRRRFGRNPAKSPGIDKPADGRPSCTAQKAFSTKIGLNAQGDYGGLDAPAVCREW